MINRLKEKQGSYICYSPIISRITGINAAIFLNQLLYWWERKTKGLLYKTVKQIEEETTLTRYQQEVAVRILLEKDFIELFIIGLPRRRHFGINFEKIEKAIDGYYDSNEKNVEIQPTCSGQKHRQGGGKSTKRLAGNHPDSWRESPSIDGGKQTQQDVENHQTYTKNTTEITTNSKTENTTIICDEKISPDGQAHFFEKENERKTHDKTNSKEKKENNPPLLRCSPLDKEKSESIHNVLKKKFFEHYHKKNGLPYYWEGKDGKHLKELIGKIRFMLEQMQKIPDENQISETFDVLLENISDKWILKNFSIPIINSKFNEILSNIKNGKNEQESNNGSFVISKDYQRSIFKRLHGN